VLHLYDLSNGMARQMSPMLLGKQIDGIWHSGIVVYNKEFYFGGGICFDNIGSTPYGRPIQTFHLGTTTQSEHSFMQFLSSIQSQFNVNTYHVLDNNCNNFTNTCAMFLVNTTIPQYILDLPNEAMNSPMGPMIRPMIESMSNQIRDASAGHELVHTKANKSVASNGVHGSVDDAYRLFKELGISSKPSLISSGRLELISKKLLEFNPNCKEFLIKLVDNDSNVVKDSSESIDFSSLNEIFKLMKNSNASSQLFPVLDLTRILILSQKSALDQESIGSLYHIIDTSLDIYISSKTTEKSTIDKNCVLMIQRICCNLIGIENESLLKSMIELDSNLMTKIIESIAFVLQNYTMFSLGCIQATINAIHNLTRLRADLMKHSGNFSGHVVHDDEYIRLLYVIYEFLNGFTEKNGKNDSNLVTFREIELLLVSIGWILCENEDAVLISQLNETPFLTSFIKNELKFENPHTIIAYSNALRTIINKQPN